jgi:hypothetical protein
MDDLELQTSWIVSIREILARCHLLPDLHTFGVMLTSAIIRERLKLIYKLLSVMNKDTNIAALELLVMMNRQSIQMTIDLYTNFNFSLQASRHLYSDSSVLTLFLGTSSYFDDM